MNFLNQNNIVAFIYENGSYTPVFLNIHKNQIQL